MNTENTNAVAIRETAPTQAQISVYDDFQTQARAVEALGLWIAKSGMLEVSKPEQANLIAFTCMAERITPLQFMRKYEIVHGRLSQKSASMLAEFRANHGGDFYWIDGGDGGKEATLMLIYKGRDTPVTYSMEEAKVAGLLGGKNENWKKRPGAMLRARCVTKALRMVCPEIAAGVYSPEEIDDIRQAELRGTRPSDERQQVAALDTSALSEDEQSQLLELIDGRLVAAESFFRDKGWITGLQTCRDVSPDRVRKWLANPTPLLSKLLEVERALNAADIEEATIVDEDVVTTPASEEVAQ